MIKINKNILTFIYIVFVAAVSVGPVFFGKGITIKPILLYFVLISMYPFTMQDVKLKKHNALNTAIIILAVFVISCGKFVYSFYKPELITMGTFLMSVGVMLIFTYTFRGGTDISEKEAAPDGRTGLIIALVLFVLALSVRLFRIADIPLGIWFDEAQNGNEVFRLLATNKFEIFIPRHTQMPAMFFWFGALFTKIFGEGVFALRFVSIILGSLSVVAMYYLLKLILRDYRLALAGALLMLFSRWHIIFSRVAFLGMQTLFFEILFFYYYIRFIKELRIGYGVISGILLGGMLYTFSAANSIPIVVFIHLIYMFVRRPKLFFKEYLVKVIITGGVALLVAAPLIIYAAKNSFEFSRRIKDVSITREVRETGNISPILKNIKLYSLMFTYTGDYNGRHNLYKKPHIDYISSVMFVAGLAIAVFSGQYIFFLLCFVFMLMAGIMTSTIEAPQAYRTIGVIPLIYIFIALFLKEIRRVFMQFGGNAKYVFLMIFTIVGAVSFINVYQYFILYPEEKSAYMDFSPAANEVGKKMAQESDRRYFYISKAANDYGFYYWEQKVILDFMTHNKISFSYLENENMITVDKTGGKEGIAVILRPSDKIYIENMQKYYGDAKVEEVRNYHNGEVLFLCYYIDTADIGRGGDRFLHK